ncbi:hypothetical protein V3C99_013115, partial [Haemonchus contortus]
TQPHGCLLKMASPLCLLLFGVIAGVLADYEGQDTTRLFFSNDGTALPGTTEDLLSRSSNGMDEVSQNNIDRNQLTFPLPTNFGEELAELSKTNPMLGGSMEELYKNITAMESDLEAKYLFFGEIIEIFKNSKKDINGSDDKTSILEKALHSIPEEGRKILVDFLNSNEHLENGRAFQMSVHTNVSAGTKTSSTCSDTPRSDSDVELRKSLKTIETILNVVINSLSYQLQQKFLLNTLVYQTRSTITSCNPLTFADIKPIFRALSETSLALYWYIENITRAKEVDLADIALYDILRKLCDIATKFNPDCGELLKSFFNYHLGGGIRFTGKTIWEHFESIGKVASAASFC